MLADLEKGMGEKMKNKKALLVISFGSSYGNARNTIESVEKYLSSQYADYDLFRAFTSRMIIKKLKNRDGIDIKVPTEALKEMYQLGYEDVICQSLHVINGIEYDVTYNEIMSFKDKFKHISLGKPLLTIEKDYEKVVEIIDGKVTRESDEALLLMGHGTKHFSNACYSMLEDMFEYKGKENIFVATVEGFPEIDFAIRKMKKKQIKKVILMPFMIVAGDHACNDMAGDEEESWKSILQSEGFEVDVILEGLGDDDGIKQLFYKHLEESRR